MDQDTLHRRVRRPARLRHLHQSYGYEEFVEGLRPVLANDAARIAAGANGEEKAEAIEATEATEAKGDVQYEIRRGIFWNLCDQPAVTRASATPWSSTRSTAATSARSSAN